MVRNDSIYDFELCDSGGNRCFWSVIENSVENGVMEKECFCLGDCEGVKYSQSATLKPTKKDECNQDWVISSLNRINLHYQKAMILSKILTPMKNVTDWDAVEDNLMQQHHQQLCENIKSNDQAVLKLRLEGPTFMTLKRSLRVTFADKLGSIGGTLGLFSGFSLLAIIELIHWICEILKSMILSRN